MRILDFKNEAFFFLYFLKIIKNNFFINMVN